MSDLLEADDGQTLTAAAVWRPDSRASHITQYAGQLWVGEYALYKGGDSPYPTEEHHHVVDRLGLRKYAWIACYPLDATDRAVSASSHQSGGETLTPEAALSTRQKVQGVAMRKVNGGTLVALSVSYGSSPSRLAFYLLPEDEATQVEVQVESDRSVPVRFLDGENYLKTLTLPAGAEEITWTPHGLAVVFEAAAAPYRDVWGGYLEDRILVLDIDAWLGVDIDR